MKTLSQLEQLIATAKTGDHDSFRVLYELFSDKVFRFIRYRTKSREVALDVLQETFVDFWKGLPQFTFININALEGFLYRIAIRKLSRSISFFKKEISLETLDDLVLEGAEQLSDMEALEAKDIWVTVWQLPPLDKEILLLRYKEGKSFQEIAQLLYQNENTLKVRHHRAIARIRKRMNYER